MGKKYCQICLVKLKNRLLQYGSIIIIVVISSVLKAISEGLENKGVSQIVHYVTYILIVTIIMKNFSDIITMVKSSIENLIAFMNSLLPILITLMATTRKYNICKYATTYNIIYYYIHRKFYKYNFNSCNINISSIKYSIKYI